MVDGGSDWPIFGRDGPDVAWRPDPGVAAASHLGRFLASTGEPSLDLLQARATADPGWFWDAATDDIAIPWARRPRETLDASGGPAWTRWWIGGAFDYAAGGLRTRLAADPDAPALDWEGEDGATRRLTNRELATEVEAAAARLRALGIGAGDRVGILLPML